MSDADRLLDRIDRGVVEHGGDLGGWTRHADGALQLFGGRVTLRAEAREPIPAAAGRAIHVHVLTTLHEYDDEVLDACLVGVGDTPDKALHEAAAIWITGVAGPIKSFLDNTPVCMTCQAVVAGGDASKGYARGDFGLPGLRAYVGPAFARGLADGPTVAALDDTKPWFRYAAEAAAPRRVHLAKVAVCTTGTAGWTRELDVDGHEASYHDPDWPAGVRSAAAGYLTRFAVFEFPRNSAEVRRRAELERTIRHFAERFARHDTVDQLMAAMVGDGFDPALVHETEAFSTIAFGRTLFDHLGVRYAPTVIRARRDGRVEPNVPLMSIPAYTRGLASAARLRETMPPAEFQALGRYNAESNALARAMEASGDGFDPAQMTMHPCVVPDRDVSDETMDAAVALLHGMVARNRLRRTKPWWKFW